MANRKINSLTKLMELSNLSRNSLDKLYKEENIESIKLETLFKLCDTFNCTLSELIEYVPDNNEKTAK